MSEVEAVDLLAALELIEVAVALIKAIAQLLTRESLVKESQNCVL